MEKRKRGKMTKKAFEEIMDLYPEHSDVINEFAEAIIEAAYGQGARNATVLCCIGAFVGGLISMHHTKFKDPRKVE